jgi:hypothetical protein
LFFASLEVVLVLLQVAVVLQAALVPLVELSQLVVVVVVEAARHPLYLTDLVSAKPFSRCCLHPLYEVLVLMLMMALAQVGPAEFFPPLTVVVFHGPA